LEVPVAVCKIALLPSLALAVLVSAGAARADGLTARPVVVELFTSQGCSSCPPANENLARISGRPGVLALSFGVTYWDYLGWRDSFAKPEFTARQYAYERSLHEATAFTPQMVVNGSTDTIGNDLGKLDALMAHSVGDQTDPPALTLSNGKVSIGAGPAPAAGADVWLVRYDPNIVEVPVARGENGGRTLPHKNVVHELVRLGAWTGAAEDFALPSPQGGLRTAILVQTAATGPILAAASD
jgi:hypothetical protein